MEDVELRDDLPDPYALVEVPKLDALALLQSIYNDPSEPKSLRVKCAIEALPTNVLAFEPQRVSSWAKTSPLAWSERSSDQA